MFWFKRNRFVGSYSFFSPTSRSYLPSRPKKSLTLSLVASEVRRDARGDVGFHGLHKSVRPGDVVVVFCRVLPYRERVKGVGCVPTPDSSLGFSHLAYRSPLKL